MRSSKGFTLVELLVVMAIIAILASIVVPNVQKYIVRARLTRAVAEVSGMELAMTAIMTDAGRGNFSQMFRPKAAETLFLERLPDISIEAFPYPEYISAPSWQPQNIDNSNAAMLFENAAYVYSRVAYDLLRLGRDCLVNGSGAVAQYYIPQDTLAKLGTNYMDIGLDAWGSSYRVWPGPWRFANPGGVRRPIPFRLFSVDTGTSGASFAVQKDDYILDLPKLQMMPVIPNPETWPSTVNYPAQANKSVFIWSLGQNMNSSHMLYQYEYDLDNPNSWFGNPREPYLDPAEEEDIAGGDDVNNWDNGNSWQRFYM